MRIKLIVSTMLAIIFASCTNPNSTTKEELTPEDVWPDSSWIKVQILVDNVQYLNYRNNFIMFDENKAIIEERPVIFPYGFIGYIKVDPISQGNYPLNFFIGTNQYTTVAKIFTTRSSKHFFQLTTSTLVID